MHWQGGVFDYEKTIEDIGHLNKVITNPDNWNNINLINKSQEKLKQKKIAISDFDLDNGDLISNAEILNMYYYNDSLSLEIEDLDSKINEYELIN